MKIERRHAQVDSTRIYYQVAGAGQPLVLVHGLSGSTRWWAHNIAPLAQHFRVHVIDLIGFGRTRSRRPFALSEAAEALVNWMAHIGIERASFIGHSMGGFIGTDLAADFPERVERLVLVGAAGLPFNYRYLQHALGLVRTLRYLPLSFVPILVTDASRAGLIPILKAAREILSTNLQHKLSRVHAPTLLIWGEHDSIVPLEKGQQLSQALPDAELIVLNAGHIPMWERPDEFNRLVIEFLREDRRAGQPLPTTQTARSR